MSEVLKVRNAFTDTVRRLLIGPNPLEGFMQPNGEEILFNGDPLKVYVSGVLFPRNDTCLKGVVELREPDDEEDVDDEPEEVADYKEVPRRSESEAVIDEETPKINARFQSAMGITLCVPNGNGLKVLISAGTYSPGKHVYPNTIETKDGKRTIKLSNHGKEKECYFRQKHEYELLVNEEDMPTKEARHKEYRIGADGEEIALRVSITYRMDLADGNGEIFTVTLFNTNTDRYTDHCSSYEKCWFQVGFSVHCQAGFLPLPRNFDRKAEDADYRLNALLYRDVRDYAIGHGCAATWEGEIPGIVNAVFMPEYEVKPIVPTTFPGVKLEMKLYSENRAETIDDLQKLAARYRDWIVKEREKAEAVPEEHRETARGQVELCRTCLARLERGVALLKTDDTIWQAFAFANRAMLMQQLHYRLPLVKYSDYDDDKLCGVLEEKIVMPQVDDEDTWFNKKDNTYGKWRPFQIAFLVMNLDSIGDISSEERKIVDLIWFPTGGGKTEAYLGLTAFTIFLRKLRDKADRGTSVIMRYTLRLLTSQQYERAASLICSMEKLRAENEELLGKERITIGLWVGGSLTPNSEKKAVENIEEIKKKKYRDKNASVILKCPWCGASMSTYSDNAGNVRTPGYSPGGAKVHFICDNPDCDFHDDEFELPLRLYDDDIYANPPTLLFGTVDKFAMLPFRPKAKSLFGGDQENAAPDLIIQDELHLITGPLGSAVGIYEVLIDELCKHNGGRPKIVASTATISHAGQQCNALYGCGEDNVFQFPVQGTSYRDSFFAHEEPDAIGRKYIGLYGSAASTSATASIAAFASLIYAAKAINVNEEKERDPYWTNLAYFGSMRELGQAATWFMTDIKERLETIYKWRMEASLDGTKRRYIYGSGQAELTSRMANDEIPKILKKLEEGYSGNTERFGDDNSEKREYPLDVCLATNMVSVGVDVPRLGLMTVTGQPKTMAEYIQATSRVGRDANHAPGIVYIIYNTAKSRDKSHYEKFQSQHGKLYYSVEPTSITPFSEPMRERALPAIFAAIHRLIYMSAEKREKATYVPSEDECDAIAEIIAERAKGIDPDETEAIKRQLKQCRREWDDWRPEVYSYEPVGSRCDKGAPLLIWAGSAKPGAWKCKGWKAPTSMRSVDGTCGLDTTKTIVQRAEGKHNEQKR